MKTHRPHSIFILLAAVCATLFVFTSVADARHESGSARLFIKRSPDLGNLAYVAVRIDGRNAGGILWAQSYDRVIPAGGHTIEVQLGPAQHNYLPSSLELNVQPGRTYSFMAVKRGGALVLAKYRGARLALAAGR